MPCYTLHDTNGKPVGHICGSLGAPCSICHDVGGVLCDFPVGAGKTCDRSMCERCATEIGPDLHYCPAHHAEWKAFRDAGGVGAELANVVPYRGR